MTAMHKLTTYLAILVLAVAAAPGAAQDVLDPEQAFRFVAVDAGDVIEIDWALEEGYYLYKKKLSFASNTDAIVLGDYGLPDGLQHEDQYFGRQEIYRDRFYVTLPYTVVGERPESLQLQVKLQGCADLGLCYLPQTWTREVPLAKRVATGPASGNQFGLSSGAMGDFLPVEQAFRAYVEAVDGNTLELSFQIADGYYLYRDKIAATSPDAQLGRIDLPEGKAKYDEYFGETRVFYDDVFGRLSLARATPEATRITVDVSFQGCAEGGICYAPATSTLTVDLPQASSLLSSADVGEAAPPQSEQSRLARVIVGSSIWVTIGVFFVAGLGLALTPCVLPMVPILSGIIAGEGDDVTPLRGFFLALSYVLGMALVYTAAGVAAAGAGLQLQATFNQPWVLILFAGVFVVLSLGMFGAYDLQMPSSIQTKLANVSGNQKSGTTVGAFVMGALSALIVTACVAPALIAALTVMAQHGDMLRGGTALFAMSMGMGAPLLAVGAAQGQLLPKAGPWMIAVKNAFGFMMLGLAVWMLSRILPGTVTLALWGILVFMGGVFLGGLTTLAADSSAAQKMGKGFGLIAVFYGAILLFGSLSGGSSLLRPLATISVAGGSGVVEREGLQFRRIKSVDDLDAALLEASASGKTAMLDFYADWCVSCLEMEKLTFTEPAVQQALAGTVLLQADVTANDEQDQELLKRFGVFGPPTIVFFGPDGVQRNGFEVVGFMKAPEFADHVARAFKTSAALTASYSDEKSEN